MTYIDEKIKDLRVAQRKRDCLAEAQSLICEARQLEVGEFDGICKVALQKHAYRANRLVKKIFDDLKWALTEERLKQVFGDEYEQYAEWSASEVQV